MVAQNTGLLESGDALRGTAVRMGAPIPVLVTGRGWARMARAGVEPGRPLDTDEGRALLTRPDVDSVALLTEATLRAWGIPFLRCDAPGEVPELLAETVERSRGEERPVALLATAGLA